MSGEGGAPETQFFDEFNKDPEGEARLSTVNNQLSELLTQLAETLHAGETDNTSAFQAYSDGLAATLEEHSLSQKEICALPDDHPLKELFFSGFDIDMFFGVLEGFVTMVKKRQKGPGEWEAEAAHGDGDEDFTAE